MKAQSPFDDLVTNTLSRVPGALSKLEYVSALRDSGGQYFHWGLARVHGEHAARYAIAQAHSQLFAAVLRMPVARLAGQAWDSCRRQRVAPGPYLQEISRRRARLVPLGASRASVLHFSLVLDALLGLAEAPSRSSPPASWLLPPPAPVSRHPADV